MPVFTAWLLSSGIQYYYAQLLSIAISAAFAGKIATIAFRRRDLPLYTTGNASQCSR